MRSERVLVKSRPTATFRRGKNTWLVIYTCGVCCKKTQASANVHPKARFCSGEGGYDQMRRAPGSDGVAMKPINSTANVAGGAQRY